MSATSSMEPVTSRAGIFLGTFLICCALLSFEVSTVRTINFSIGPSYIFIAISLAMLGLTAAGSLLSLFDLTKIKARRETVLAVLCVAIALLLILSNFFVVATKDTLNAEIRAAGEAGGLSRIISTLLETGTRDALGIGMFLTFPYFLFGALLSYLFATSDTREYSRLYAVDLIGAAFGCIAIVGLMQFTSYAFSVTAPAICALLAGAAFVSNHKTVASLVIAVVAVAVGLMSMIPAVKMRIEPVADPNYLVRDYEMATDRVELWHGWNSYTRVAAVERSDAPGEAAVLSLANGDGMAFLHPYVADRAEPYVHYPVIPALLSGPAESALVIFAGAGADLMSLRENGVSRVVGVEINERIVEAGLDLTDYNLESFLALEDVSLHIDEARSFLEQDTETYDMVLVSWSGATAVYYLGALGGTTQYIYTYEGLSAILGRLNDDGRAIILEGNKVDMLHGLRRYMTEHELPNPERAAVILRFTSEGSAGLTPWNNNWDANPLLIKPSGWTEAEVAEIAANAPARGYSVIYGPGIETHPDYTVYEQVLTAADADAEVAAISAADGQRFGVSTDNRPFYLDHFQTSRYFGSDFWFKRPFDTIVDLYRFQQVVLICTISIAALFLSLVPLAFSRDKVESRARSATYLMYFLLLGSGFMFVEIGLIQRIGILFGNPGLTIAIVLCVLILATGIGSMMSNWSFSRGLTIRVAAILVVAYAVLAAFVVPLTVHAVIGTSLFVRIAVTIALIAPGGWIMGHLFPQGMALAGHEDKSLTSWAWAINGAMSASVAGIAPLVAQATGFVALFFIGAALYAGVIFLPMVRKTPRAQT